MILYSCIESSSFLVVAALKTDIKLTMAACICGVGGGGGGGGGRQQAQAGNQVDHIFHVKTIPIVQHVQCIMCLQCTLISNRTRNCAVPTTFIPQLLVSVRYLYMPICEAEYLGKHEYSEQVK